jgi:hypothetical protein
MAQDRGIFWLSLVDQDRDNLQEQIPQVFERVAEHLHVTLQYNVPLTEEIAQFLWKEPIPVQVTANCFNHQIQAVRVQLPEFVRTLCQNADPHMTISMVQGTRPVQSNVMLGSNHVEQPLEVTLLFRAEFRHFS